MRRNFNHGSWKYYRYFWKRYLGKSFEIVIKYFDIIKNWIKATLSWLKQKIKAKLYNKKNGQVLLSNTGEVKNVALQMLAEARRTGNVHKLADLEETVQSIQRVEREGNKSMMVDIDAYGNVGTWESVRDEDQDVRNLKGREGYTVIEQ